MSSKLTIATSCWRPSACTARTAPIEIRFWAANSAVGGLLPLEQLACGLIRVDPTELRMPDQVEILSEAVLRERLAVPPQTLGGGEHVRPVAEEADPAMARRDQVGDRGARAADVVGDAPRRRRGSPGGRSTKTSATPAARSRSR